MGSEWKHCKIGELFELIPGFAFKSKNFVSSGVPVIKIKNVKANSVVLNNLSYVDESFLNERKDKIIKRGDILITMSGNRFGSTKETWVGKVAQFTIPGSYLLNQRVGILRPKPGIILNSRFCTYILSSNEYQKLFIAIATSSGGQANISPLQILGADILLPPLYEQHAIAHILGSIDDRIELNLNINTTLKAIAEAIFKSWFVDFDPVWTKMRRRPPDGMDSEIATLFPQSFEDSRLGKVPMGWRVGKLGDVIELAYGKGLRESDRVIGKIPVYGSNGQVGWHNEALVNGPGIVVGRKGNPGIIEWSHSNFFPIDTTFYVIPIGDITSFSYLFHELMFQNLPALGADSAVPGLNRNIAYMNSIILPNPKLVSEFDSKVKPLFAMIYANEKQNTSLADTRDSLLPRFLSGKIRLKDAEKFIENMT